MSITNQPVVLYLNEPYVNQQMQIANEGMIQEVVEEYGEIDGTKTSGGLKVYNILTALRERTSERSENVAKNIQSTPIGRFAVYHGLVDDSGDLTEIDLDSNEDIPDLNDGDYISLTGKLSRAPITDLMNTFDKLGWSLADMMDEPGSDKDISGEQLEQEFREASDYYRISIGGSDQTFFFRLSDEFMQSVGPDFPNEYAEYTVFAEVNHCFQRGQKRSLVDLLNDVPQRDRGRGVDIRGVFRQLASAMNELPGRNFSQDDFYISHPDILLDPIAVYR